MNSLTTVTFADNFTVSVGQCVKFSTRYGSQGQGTVTKISESQSGVTRIHLEPSYEGERGRLDGWPLKDGGEFDRLRDHGVFGGEICR